jgi:hypothetical protein
MDTDTPVGVASAALAAQQSNSMMTSATLTLAAM